ncbi:HPP family protein [Lysinibacillus endophyticus]|uniref:HPP family protein n=1 Tax=Ureibacillus endophyticus TaxID=1978490 RepID=A0A494Z8Q6_9BACL|nr:HPP family protein [Lysinibacillus endophyticus]MCP1143388.1 HPP family protein [Lysinibacillus endophyticus]RKQ19014.1 HPP family protein [Lysinibacillus endophyticus]
MENKTTVNEHYLKTLISKMTGYSKSNSRTSVSDAMIAAVGAFCCVLPVFVLTEYTNSIWFIASFGASIMLVIAAWNAPVGQPRNVIGSYLIASIISLTISTQFGSSPILISLALCLTIFFMLLARTFHPPACGNTIIIMMGDYGWDFIFHPVLLGTIIIVIFALIINNLHPKRKYPMYWW